MGSMGDRVSCCEKEANDSHAPTFTEAEDAGKADLNTDDVKMHKKDKGDEETGREEVGLGSRCSWLAPLDQDKADPPPLQQSQEEIEESEARNIAQKKDAGELLLQKYKGAS